MKVLEEVMGSMCVCVLGVLWVSCVGVAGCTVSERRSVRVACCSG